MRIGSLCSGAGALDLAVVEAFGGNVAWHCEVDPAASRVLEHRFPDAPNHGDLTVMDWDTVEPVDIIAAGWPCQPWSTAGKRKGADDERAIWPGVARAIRDLRPRWVVLENVAAIVAAGELARAVGDLSSAGYDSRWVCVRASDAGAPHGRRRVFAAAEDTDRAACGQRWVATPGQAQSGWTRSDTGGRSGVPSSHPSFAERPGPKSEDLGSSTARTTEPRECSGAIAWGGYEPAIRRWESTIGRPAPAPTVAGRTGHRLNPAFAEWMMGWPKGWVTEVPGLSRNDQLKVIGNGAVPQQAELALSWLLAPLAVAA